MLECQSHAFAVFLDGFAAVSRRPMFVDYDFCSLIRPLTQPRFPKKRGVCVEDVRPERRVHKNHVDRSVGHATQIGSRSLEYISDGLRSWKVSVIAEHVRSLAAKQTPHVPFVPE